MGAPHFATSTADAASCHLQESRWLICNMHTGQAFPVYDTMRGTLLLCFNGQLSTDRSTTILQLAELSGSFEKTSSWGSSLVDAQLLHTRLQCYQAWLVQAAGGHIWYSKKLVELHFQLLH